MSKKTILITGSNGLLGQKLVYNLVQRDDIIVFASSRGEDRLLHKNGYQYKSIDYIYSEEVASAIAEINPDVLIHTAAMTNVDACELNHTEAIAANVEAVKNIITALEKFSPQCHFIHLSTDFIFDGEAGPYKEDDIPNPISFYAQTKLDAELLVKACKLKWSIVRTVLVYGVVDNMSRSNVVLWAKNSLEEKKKINVVDDQFRTPTLAEDLADGCILIADKGAEGVYNISGKNYMSILELVNQVADYYSLDKNLITPSKSTDIKQPAKRPPVTGFVLDKAFAIGYQPHSFTEGLAIVEAQLKKSKIA